MKLLYYTIAAAMLFPAGVYAQETDGYSGSDPSGIISYSLPSTTLSFEVEAVQEHFFAGPYAKFASKYLGIDVRQKDAVTYQLADVRMTPYVEADQSCRFVFNHKDSEMKIPFLKLTSAGLVSFGDGNYGSEQVWRFPVASKEDFAGKGVSSNLTTEETTLYRSVKKESAYDRIAVRQDMVVEKSEEKRAAETAAMIFSLREKRLQIVTGDTDATYSGEAMGAAIEEISRLEKEYLTLFTGYSEYQTQKMHFDVVPEKGRDSQLYVAFRISDTAGLLPADNISGKPVILEIVPQKFAEPELSKKDAKGNKGPVIVYRIPAVCTLKLLNGTDVILQSRIPVFQLGIESTMPVSVKTR